MSRSETEKLLNAALEISRPELERLVVRLFALKATEETPNLTRKESELLLNNNRRVPKDLQRRYDASTCVDKLQLSSYRLMSTN